MESKNQQDKKKVRNLTAFIWKETAENMKGQYLSHWLFEQRQDTFTGFNFLLPLSPSILCQCFENLQVPCNCSQRHPLTSKGMLRVGGPFQKWNIGCNSFYSFFIFYKLQIDHYKHIGKKYKMLTARNQNPEKSNTNTCTIPSTDPASLISFFPKWVQCWGTINIIYWLDLDICKDSLKHKGIMEA